jgi:hypothetical protein
MNISITLNDKNFPAMQGMIHRIADTENMTAKTTVGLLNAWSKEEVTGAIQALKTLPADGVFVVSVNDVPTYSLSCAVLVNRLNVASNPQNFQVKELQPKSSTKKAHQIEALVDADFLAQFA